MLDLRGEAMPELPDDDVQSLPRIGLLRARLLRGVLEVALRLPAALPSLWLSRLQRERARRDLRHGPREPFPGQPGR